MTRNWGLPQKPDDDAFRRARTARPLAVLGLSAVYGVIGAAIAAISFTEARALGTSLFHGLSLVAAVVAAGFGCWAYIWLARPRFAAHFTGESDAFSDLLRFYFIGALTLLAIVATAKLAGMVIGDIAAIVLLCVSGGAGAAAAFQTVIAFVPSYRTS